MKRVLWLKTENKGEIEHISNNDAEMQQKAGNIRILKDLGIRGKKIGVDLWEQELALFLNTWGDLKELPNRNQDFDDGYKKAIRDIWEKFDFDNIFSLKYKKEKEKHNGK